MKAYVACRTTEYRNARGRGIEVYNVTDGGWENIQTISVLDNPSYICVDRSGKFLYAVHGDMHHVSSYKFLPDGRLKHLNIVDSQGKNPVYITPNITNEFLFVASLQGGAVATLKIQEDGSLSEAVSVEYFEGITPQGVSHAHQCELDKTGKYLLVPTQGRHIGYERVYVLAIDNTTGKLTRCSHVTARSYAEPRTLAISEDNTRVYLMNEKGNYVTYYNFNDTTGTLTPLQIVPSLPETYVGEGQASAILIHPNGRFVYGTNRIHESIVTYRLNENTGFLATLGFTSALGKTPRFFMFSPEADQLVVANEDTDTIRFFDVDSDTGALIFADKTVATGSPTGIVFREEKS